VEQAAEPVRVLLDQRPVGPELVVQVVDDRLVSERAEDGPPDVAGKDLGAEEDDQAEQPERDESEYESLEQEPSDRDSSSSGDDPPWPARAC
jgi:hypothetical protein